VSVNVPVPCMRRAAVSRVSVRSQELMTDERAPRLNATRADATTRFSLSDADRMETRARVKKPRSGQIKPRVRAWWY